MDTTSNNIWAKLVALRPESQNLSFITKPDEPNQYQVNGEWKIYQDAAGDTKMVCLSASCIKVNDIWLGMNQESKLQGGEMIAFSEEKNIADNSFDYVFCLINKTPVEKLKRDENDESKYKLICQKMEKFTNEMNQEFNCAICIETISDCATLIPCLHHFCGHCIAKLKKSSNECPLCRKKIQSWNHNLFLQRIIDSTTSVLNLQESKQKGAISKESNPQEEYGNYIGEYSSDGKREGQGKMTYDNGNIYEGAWKNGQREGKGKMTYKEDRTIFEGNWQNGKREGEGFLTSPYGAVCKGEWIDDVQQPFGTIECPNGDSYFGEIKDGMRHGNGVFLSYNNNSTYNGSWLQDMKHGQGKEVHGRRTYEGGWMFNEMHGHGKMEFRSVGVLEGDWHKGKISEGAIFTRTNGDIFKGKWKNYSQGEGEINFANGGKQFRGSWRGSSSKNWTLTLKNGNMYSERESSSSKVRQFCIRYANNDIYTGMVEMENLYRQGKGEMFFKKDFHEYEGEFDQDKLHGKGKYISKKDGFVYEGQFQNGKRNGIGTLTTKDGTKWTGEWKDDEKVIPQYILQEDSTNKN